MVSNQDETIVLLREIAAAHKQLVVLNNQLIGANKTTTDFIGNVKDFSTRLSEG
jgi:hypothetical protein